MRLAFDPVKQGFHFSNNDITWSFGPIHSRALCGGMIYAALDYWWAGQSIPQQAAVPREGEPLHSLIYDRQLDAHKNTVLTFGTCYLNAVPQEGYLSPKYEYDRLLKFLAAGQPVPVCLFKRSWHGHHTLGFAAEPGSMSFEVYDPNYPKKKSFITAGGSGFKHSEEGAPWDGFFVDAGYEYEKPPLFEGESGWVRCMDCRLLYSGADALCPKGGRHNPTGSAKYVLNKNAGHGQGDWRKCFKCRSLYFAGNPGSAGICADGGIHGPVPNAEYTLAVDGEGQGNWRRCIYCEGLFWLSGGGIGGVCAANKRHESDLGKMFSIPFKS